MTRPPCSPLLKRAGDFAEAVFAARSEPPDAKQAQALKSLRRDLLALLPGTFGDVDAPEREDLVAALSVDFTVVEEWAEQAGAALWGAPPSGPGLLMAIARARPRSATLHLEYPAWHRLILQGIAHGVPLTQTEAETFPEDIFSWSEKQRGKMQEATHLAENIWLLDPDLGTAGATARMQALVASDGLIAGAYLPRTWVSCQQFMDWNFRLDAFAVGDCYAPDARPQWLRAWETAYMADKDPGSVREKLRLRAQAAGLSTEFVDRHEQERKLSSVLAEHGTAGQLRKAINAFFGQLPLGTLTPLENGVPAWQRAVISRALWQPTLPPEAWGARDELGRGIWDHFPTGSFGKAGLLEKLFRQIKAHVAPCELVGRSFLDCAQGMRKEGDYYVALRSLIRESEGAEMAFWVGGMAAQKALATTLATGLGKSTNELHLETVAAALGRAHETGYPIEPHLWTAMQLLAKAKSSANGRIGSFSLPPIGERVGLLEDAWAAEVLDAWRKTAERTRDITYPREFLEEELLKDAIPVAHTGARLRM